MDSNKDDTNITIQSKNTNFSYLNCNPQSKLCIRNLNLEIEKGELIFVIGGIGSGKSSMLLSLLGELNQGNQLDNNNNIKLKGSVTYFPQNPFLMTKSIRDNILFWKDEN